MTKIKDSKKILFLISSMDLGGAQRQVCLMANYWATNGKNVGVLVLDDGKIAPSFSFHKNVKFIPLSVASRKKNNLFSLGNVKKFFLLRKKIREFSPDVALAFLEKMAIITLFSSIGLKVPIIACERTVPFLHDIGILWNFFRKLAYPLALRVAVQTKEACNYLSFIGSKRKFIVIPNGINLFPSLQREEIEKEKVIVSVGRLSKEKSYNDLIKAFVASKLSNDGWTLKIIGSGNMEHSLSKLIKELKTEASVKLIGFKKDPITEIRKAYIYVQTSLYEGFPNALLEAMSIGLPVISSDCPCGPKEVISDNENGYLFPVGDVRILRQKLVKLAKDSALQKKFSKNALKTMKKYDLDKIMLLWDTILNNATKNKRSTK